MDVPMFLALMAAALLVLALLAAIADSAERRDARARNPRSQAHPR